MMKKLILVLLSALALLPGGMLRSGDVRAAETFAVQSPRRDHRANPHANCHGERYEDRRGRYTKDSWSVYYRGRKVEGASVSSFADLGGGYGKDNWTVYYRGWKVEGASASSFADLGGGYGKDNWTVFYEGRKLEGASAMSFEYNIRFKSVPLVVMAMSGLLPLVVRMAFKSAIRLQTCLRSSGSPPVRRIF